MVTDENRYIVRVVGIGVLTAAGAFVVMTCLGLFTNEYGEDKAFVPGCCSLLIPVCAVAGVLVYLTSDDYQDKRREREPRR